MKEKYLVEYRMFWAGKVIREGIEEVDAINEFFAKSQTEKNLKQLNRRAEILIGDAVKV